MAKTKTQLPGVNFAGGSYLPSVGSAAYTQAQQGSGYGSYDPTSGALSTYATSQKQATANKKVKPVSVISSTKGESIVNNGITGQTDDMNRYATAQGVDRSQKYDPTTGKPITPEDTTNVATGGYTYDEAKQLGLDLNTATYDSKTNTYSPGEATTFDTQKKDIVDSTNTDLKEIKSVFDKQLASLDAASQDVISGLMASYQTRAKAQADTNKRELQTYQTMGIRSGGARYAGSTNQGILNAEERVGLDRLDKIAAEQATAVSNAQQALAEKKYSVFIDQRNEVNKLKKDKQDQISKLVEANNKAKDQSKRDALISEYIGKGISDPSEIFTALRKDGDTTTTAKDVADTLKSLSPNGDLTGLSSTLKDFYAVKQRGLLPSSVASLPENEQYFAYLRQQKSVTTKATGTGTGVTAPKTDVADGVARLNANKGPDGFVDPYFYKQMYDTWVDAGYSTDSFVKNYPPKYYVNPAASDIPSLLPSYLKPPKTASGRTT